MEDIDLVPVDQESDDIYIYDDEEYVYYDDDWSPINGNV